jgi:hypothetical protein
MSPDLTRRRLDLGDHRIEVDELAEERAPGAHVLASATGPVRGAHAARGPVLLPMPVQVPELVNLAAVTCISTGRISALVSHALPGWSRNNEATNYGARLGD